MFYPPPETVRRISAYRDKVGHQNVLVQAFTVVEGVAVIQLVDAKKIHHPEPLYSLSIPGITDQNIEAALGAMIAGILLHLPVSDLMTKPIEGDAAIVGAYGEMMKDANYYMQRAISEMQTLAGKVIGDLTNALRGCTIVPRYAEQVDQIAKHSSAYIGVTDAAHRVRKMKEGK